MACFPFADYCVFCVPWPPGTSYLISFVDFIYTLVFLAFLAWLHRRTKQLEAVSRTHVRASDYTLFVKHGLPEVRVSPHMPVCLDNVLCTVVRGLFVRVFIAPLVLVVVMVPSLPRKGRSWSTSAPCSRSTLWSRQRPAPQT